MGNEWGRDSKAMTELEKEKDLTLNSPSTPPSPKLTRDPSHVDVERPSPSDTPKPLDFLVTRYHALIAERDRARHLAATLWDELDQLTEAVTRFASVRAISARALGDSDHERSMLDVLALVERAS